MKILRVINSMNPEKGGPCQGIRNTIPQIDLMGHVSEVVCLDDSADAWIGKDKFKVYAVGKASGPWAYNKNLMGWLKENLGNYDAVIIHGLWQYHSYTVIKAVKNLRKSGKSAPMVYVMPHGMLDPYFQKASGRKLKAIRNSVFWHIIESEVVNSADGILYTCQEELELAAQTFSNYRPKEVYNVGYGILQPPVKSHVSIDAFYSFCPEAKEKPFILFLSRVHEKKGVDLLLKAFDKVYNSQSNVPMLIVAGPGMDSEYGKSLQNIVAQSDFLKSNVRFVGMIQSDIKWSAFYNCEVFILPSHQENFGIAVAEAMACSKSVLISDKVNIWQEIKNGRGGYVENDTEQGTEKMLRQWLNTSAADREMMANHAFETYKQFFTVEQAASNLLKVINTRTENA
ncbi:MAG: glycosyltransferase [Chitinophagaceae bacterium]